MSDDRGEYRILNLRPGKYCVSAVVRAQAPIVNHAGERDNTLTVPITTHYPGVPAASQAAPVVVSSGARVSGIVIAVARARVFRIEGSIDLPPDASRIIVSLPLAAAV